MLVDLEYENILKEQVKEQLEETKKELKWHKEFYQLMTKKVQDYFLNELEVDRFTVKALKTKNLVTTFKVKKMSDYTNKTLEEIYQFLNEDSRPDTGQSITKGGKEVDFAKEYGIYTREQEIEQM